MKITIVHFHFKIPRDGGALRSYFLALGLKNRGHNIDVITTHYSNTYEKAELEGIVIHLLPVKYLNKYGFIKRIRSFLSFNNKATKLITDLPKPDLLYCISTPLTIGLVGIKIKKILDIPFVFEVGDLWPEAPIQMGVVKSKWLGRKLFQLERKIYSQSIGVVALSKSIRDSIGERSTNENVATIPNMSDTQFFVPNNKSERTDELMPGYQFIIACIGAIGKANHLDHLLDAARYFNNEGLDVGFLIMGEGSESDRLRRIASDLPNLNFLPFSNRNVVKEVLESVDAVYVSFKSIPVLETGSPNKYFDALAAGKLIITNFGGWISQEIEANNCGFQYTPEDPEELIEKLRPYLNNDDLLNKASENSRALAFAYEKEALLDALNDWLNSTLSIAEHEDI